MKIKELIKHLEHREIPTVHEEECINDVIQVMVRFPHTRLVYVIDDHKKLQGSITVGSMLRHIFPHHYEARIHPRGMLRRITAEKACHLMDKKNVFASPDETVDAVLKRMARTGVKEMAVLDNDGYILTDITAIDLLQHYHLKEEEC